MRGGDAPRGEEGGGSGGRATALPLRRAVLDAADPRTGQPTTRRSRVALTLTDLLHRALHGLRLVP